MLSQVVVLLQAGHGTLRLCGALRRQNAGNAAVKHWRSVTTQGFLPGCPPAVRVVVRLDVVAGYTRSALHGRQASYGRCGRTQSLGLQSF